MPGIGSADQVGFEKARVHVVDAHRIACDCQLGGSPNLIIGGEKDLFQRPHMFRFLIALIESGATAQQKNRQAQIEQANGETSGFFKSLAPLVERCKAAAKRQIKVGEGEV